MGLFAPDLPKIIVAQSDHHDLLVLAMSGTNHSAEAADDLMFELGRASVRPDHALPEAVVRMGDEIVFSLDGGGPHRAVLVYPHEMGLHPRSVSILSPVGTALLGLRPGQTMTWWSSDGRRRTLEVHAVDRPLGSAPSDGGRDRREPSPA